MRSTIARLVSIAAALLALHAAQGAAAEAPSRGSSIHRAVFAEGRLWLLDTGGRLSSLAEGGERSDVPTPDPVMELLTQDQRVVIVTCPEQSCSSAPVARWIVRRRVGDDWETVADIATKGEQFRAATSTMLLTDSRMIDLAGGALAETALTSRASDPITERPKPQAGEHFRFGGSWQLTGSGTIDLTEGMPWQAPARSPLVRPKPLRSLPVAAVLVTPRHVFVGYNAGEWGGGLQRIDRTTGVVSDIDDVEGDLCGGKLNPACDPVNGLAVIPWKQDCIAVAVGLIHMLAHGRIVEVCDRAVHLLYSHEIQERLSTADGRPGSMWTYTSAFFGLQQTGEELLAVGHDGLYQIGRGDLVRQIPLPRFRPADGLAVSFDMPGLVLVLTTANRRFSLSGSTPMLLPR
ncbi:hypothetical protein [Bradyrhizobium sp. SRS-191]|uniref:hypothetical protein n=1 Tax=Bradyrhizobium sp. SRS-191 TaxID=2962606 RepID=UPI00211F3AF6|nr:hypothetical protein [Bradyrhizobium sp. SRS-191]